MNEVMDLNDLVKSVKFTVLEKNYEIPPMNDIKMKKVMSLSKKITTLTKATEDPNDSMSDQQEEELFDTQNTILCECVNLLSADDKLSQVDKKDFSLWPMRLKNKVLELVFDQIGGGTPEGETEKN